MLSTSTTTDPLPNTPSDDVERDDVSTVKTGRRSSWSEVIASLVFFVATYEALALYGIVHWGIMFRWDPSAPKPPDAVFNILAHLSLLRLAFSLCALIWAIWSFGRAPRWATWIALALAMLAVFSNAIVT